MLPIKSIAKEAPYKTIPKSVSPCHAYTRRYPRLDSRFRGNDELAQSLSPA